MNETTNTHQIIERIETLELQLQETQHNVQTDLDEQNKMALTLVDHIRKPNAHQPTPPNADPATATEPNPSVRPTTQPSPITQRLRQLLPRLLDLFDTQHHQQKRHHAQHEATINSINRTWRQLFLLEEKLTKQNAEDTQRTAALLATTANLHHDFQTLLDDSP